MAASLADDIFKCISMNQKFCILISNFTDVFPKGPIKDIPALVQIMARRRTGDNPLSEPMLTQFAYTYTRRTDVCHFSSNWCIPIIFSGMQVHIPLPSIKLSVKTKYVPFCYCARQGYGFCYYNQAHQFSVAILVSVVCRFGHFKFHTLKPWRLIFTDQFGCILLALFFCILHPDKWLHPFSWCLTQNNNMWQKHVQLIARNKTYIRVTYSLCGDNIQ